MKTSKSIILSVLLLSSVNLFSQTTKDISKTIERPNVINLSPLVILRGQAIEVHYERALTPSLSAAVGFAPIIIGEINDGSTGLTSAKGFAIDPEIRLYASKDRVLNGFYIGMYSYQRFSNWSQSDVWQNTINEILGSANVTDPTYKLNDTYKINKSRSSYGLQMGFQPVFGKWFVIDFNTGLGYGSANYTSINNRSAWNNTQNKGFLDFRLNFSLGVKF